LKNSASRDFKAATRWPGWPAFKWAETKKKGDWAAFLDYRETGHSFGRPEPE